MWCPRCGAEYRSEFWRCAECEVPLEARPSGEAGHSTDLPVDLVTVRTCESASEAAIARSALSAAEIPSSVHAGAFQAGWLEIQVPRELAEVARALLDGNTPRSFDPPPEGEAEDTG